MLFDIFRAKRKVNPFDITYLYTDLIGELHAITDTEWLAMESGGDVVFLTSVTGCSVGVRVDRDWLSSGEIARQDVLNEASEKMQALKGSA